MQLRNAKRKGVQDGFQTAALLTILALYNVADDYVEPDKQALLAKAIEEEANRIFTESCKNEIEDIGDLFVGHAEMIRKKWGMEPLEVQR